MTTFLGHYVFLPDLPSLYHITITEKNTWMHLNDSVNNNVEIKKQVLLTLLFLVSAVRQLKDVFKNIAVVCMRRTQTIIKTIFCKGYFYLRMFSLV